MQRITKLLTGEDSAKKVGVKQACSIRPKTPGGQCVISVRADTTKRNKSGQIAMEAI